MDSRLGLDTALRAILPSGAIYFQPPENIKMVYPCIVYELSGINTWFANSLLYRYKKRYTVTVIDKNPDSLIPLKILHLPLCSFDRFFTFDNLNHTVFSIYY